MKNKSREYSPKQLAAIYGLRKDTLLYYDKTGLLKPAGRKPNGYRYYTSSQLSELEAILALKELGFSLSSVKEATQGLDREGFMDVLAKEMEGLGSRIDTLTQRLLVTQSLYERMDEAMHHNEGDLYIKEMSTTGIALQDIQGDGPTTEEEWNRSFDELVHRLGFGQTAVAGSMLDLEAARSGGSSVKAVYTICVPRGESNIPAGHYACMCFHGPCKDMGPSYKRFFNEVDARGLSLDGPVWEEYAVSSMVTKETSELVTVVRVRLA